MFKTIEHIRVGDIVVSRDEQTQQMVLKPVVRVFKRTVPQILNLSLVAPDGKIETFGTTAEHPFHVPGRGFVNAGDLQPGDLVSNGGSVAQSPLLLASSKENDASGFLRVKSLELEDRATPVYNFEVADTHTYFVGQTKAWVHNTCVGAVRKLANKLPASCKERFACNQFADGLKESMQKKGLKGQHVTADPGRYYIYSDKFKKLGEQGIPHQAIRVGDTIFDNMHPKGVPYDQWAKDIGVGLPNGPKLSTKGF